MLQWYLKSKVLLLEDVFVALWHWESAYGKWQLPYFPDLRLRACIGLDWGLEKKVTKKLLVHIIEFFLQLTNHQARPAKLMWMCSVQVEMSMHAWPVALLWNQGRKYLKW